MATATRKGTRTKAAKPEPTTGSYDPAALPQVGSLQFRQGGDYKPSIKDLSAFAKGNPTLVGHVKALVHLGWVKPGGVNDSSTSPACKIATEAELPAECWTFGEAAAPQISANIQALAEAGAPTQALNSLWDAYVGTI